MKLFDRDLWAEVYSTLTKNMFRTILTTLGVVFAVIILIVLLGASTGMKNGFDKILTGTATNSLFIWGQNTGKPYKGFERGRRIRFTFDDVTMLKEEVKEIKILAPRIQLGGHRGVENVNRNGQTSGASVYGDYPAIDKISKKNLIEGRFLNEDDMRSSRKVCVIGEETYELLYKIGENAIGTYVQINGVYFQVVGVFGNSKVDIDGQNAVFVPFSTFKKAFNSGNKVGWMAIEIEEGKNASVALKKIKKLLKQKYSVHPDDERGIGSFDLSQQFQGIQAFTTVLQAFSFFIGVFTLLAGVIAISNILLITVKERTKEIGIRRAIGATPGIIKKQIIFEAIALTVFSGLIGFSIAVLILHVLDSLFGNTEYPFVNPTVSLPQVFVSFLLMLILSLIVGLIPARRAIKIRPIEALRED